MYDVYKNVTDELDQTINIWNKDYEKIIELYDNHFIDDLFSKHFIGEQESTFYHVVIGEDGFKEVYKYLTLLLGYKGFDTTDGLDDREGIWELYDAMCEAIKDGQLLGIQLEYYLELGDEE